MEVRVFYEPQLPLPWADDGEYCLLQEALEQVVLADRLGYDFAWEVEHHSLEEYSHASAPEVLLAAVAALTDNIRVDHSIRQLIPDYNHPARTAEGIATLGLISDGRVEFGLGAGQSAWNYRRLASRQDASGRSATKICAHLINPIGTVGAPSPHRIPVPAQPRRSGYPWRTLAYPLCRLRRRYRRVEMPFAFGMMTRDLCMQTRFASQNPHRRGFRQNRRRTGVV